MKRILIYFAFIIICFLLQSTVFKRLSFAGAAPNLIVIVTSSIGFIRGQREGMYVGFFCGILFDFFWGYTPGFYTILLTAIGFVNGCFHRLYFDNDIKFPILFAGISEMLFSLVSYVSFYFLQGDFEAADIFSQIILPELIYTIIMTLILYNILYNVNKILEEKEQRSASRFV